MKGLKRRGVRTFKPSSLPRVLYFGSIRIVVVLPSFYPNLREVKGKGKGGKGKV